MYKKSIIVILLSFFLYGCTDVKKENIENISKDLEPVVKEEVPSYIDNNSFPISFYNSKNGTLYKIQEVKESFVSKKDITTIQVFPSTDDSIILSTDKGSAFNDKWNEYDESHLLKQGFNINYTLEDGTVINQNILGPSTTQLNYDYIEIYLYDAYAHRNDKWYSHIEEKEMNDKTFFTSIKLTAGSRVSDISSKIKLTTFTYDTEDDFLDNGDYRGQSQSTIVICDINKTCDI